MSIYFLMGLRGCRWWWARGRSCAYHRVICPLLSTSLLCRPAGDSIWVLPTRSEVTSSARRRTSFTGLVALYYRWDGLPRLDLCKWYPGSCCWLRDPSYLNEIISGGGYPPKYFFENNFKNLTCWMYRFIDSNHCQNNFWLEIILMGYPPSK